ncbi:MAG: hypothetical protein KDD10_14470, partial [Phaeodactylibacter sp.]|nr:hypothetical protein [Phaeodactylibacter sp.]
MIGSPIFFKFTHALFYCRTLEKNTITFGKGSTGKSIFLKLSAGQTLDRGGFDIFDASGIPGYFCIGQAFGLRLRLRLRLGDSWKDGIFRSAGYSLFA